MDNDERVLPLTPIEHVFTGPGSYAITFALVYDRRLDPAQLKSSLGQALEDFWPLCGRLVPSPSHSYSIRCAEGDSVHLEVSESGDSFDASAQADILIRPVSSVPGEPLTRIRLTQTPAGSVLGVSISHALVDGFSFFHFLTSWARIAAGARILTPLHEREALVPSGIDPVETVDAGEVLSQCGLFWRARELRTDDDLPAEEILPLPRESIRGLREEAQRDSDLPLSDNDVLAAHAWKEYGAAWAHLGDDATTYVTIPFDFRRLLKELPRTYFGSALAFATASMDRDSLVGASLGEVAAIVHDAVARATADHALSSMRYLEALRRGGGLPAVQGLDVRHPDRGLLVTNISRLPISSVDFGSGPPVALKPVMEADRAVAILPAEDGVLLSLLPPADKRPGAAG